MCASYRAEVIGSLLRPSWLKAAQARHQAGELSTPEFKRIEDQAVAAAIALQEDAGVDVITDGELRRSSFVGPLTDVVDGVAAVPDVIGAQTQWHDETKPRGDATNRPRMAIQHTLRRRRLLAAEEFTYLRARATTPVKATLPSPLMMALLWSPDFSTDAYPDPFALFADAAQVLREEITELAGLGCRYVQIDAPELATLVDPTTRHYAYEQQGISPDRLLGEGIDMLNAIADVPGVTCGLHLCRGNNAGEWMASGGYEAISKQVFTRARGYDIYLLEYDDWRSGGFEPLADVPSDKRVVLGLVSTKTDTLEPAAGLADRVDEAARHFPREQIALSTQCGFASVLEGNPVAEETQSAKLKLVAEVAHQLWP